MGILNGIIEMVFLSWRLKFDGVMRGERGDFLPFRTKNDRSEHCGGLRGRFVLW